LNEKIIISELKKRNKKVFESLFKKYYPWLKSVAINYVFDSDTADDIIQNFFIHLWENVDNINVKSSLKAYFTKAVRNRCLNFLRDKKVTDKNQILYLEANFQHISSNDEVSQEKENLASEIMEMIDSLPEKMARIFLQKYHHGMRIEEIAKENKISDNTVKTQLKRAKEKIRKHFSKLVVLISFIT